jgi:hypothetical protein
LSWEAKVEENQVQCENLTEELPPAKDSRDFYFRAMKASNWISDECKRIGAHGVALRLGLSADTLGDILIGRWEARLDEILWLVCDGKIPLCEFFSEESILEAAESILDGYTGEAGLLLAGDSADTENP